MAERERGVRVTYDLRNDTLEGMSRESRAMLAAAVAAARYAGLARISVIGAMDVGRRGHLSHFGGSEWDIKGFNANGTPWSAEQRVAVATGAAQAGGNRFGFYPGGSLHMGLGYGRMPRNVAWGPGGALRGVRGASFNAAEQAFVDALRAGKIGEFAVQNGPLVAVGPSSPPEVIGKLQSSLRSAGIDLDVDGVWGPGTQRALREYQAASGLSVDGFAGTDVLASLEGQRIRMRSMGPRSRRRWRTLTA